MNIEVEKGGGGGGSDRIQLISLTRLSVENLRSLLRLKIVSSMNLSFLKKRCIIY